MKTLSSNYIFRILLVFCVALLRCSSSQGSNDNPGVQTATRYFQQFNPGFSISALSPLGVSSEERAFLDLKMEDNPIFRDTLVNFQKMADLKPTGTVNKETLDKMGEARCGVPDESSDPDAPGRYEVQSRWYSKKDRKTGFYVMTYSFPKRNTPDTLRFQNFRRGVILAMCSWELISNVRFKGIGVGKTNADILISYEQRNHGDGYSFDGRGGTLGHAFYPEDGRVHLDLDEDWYLALPKKENTAKKDVYTAALHEFGHTIGLLHSKERRAVMEPFYRYRGTFGTFDMPQDEIDGVEDMYGKRIDSNPADEKFSACKEAKKRYNVNIVPPKIKSATETAVLEEFDNEKPCDDDPFHKVTHCPAWKARNLCTVDIFVSTMLKRCKKTCGFCPGDKEVEKVSSPSGLKTSSICEINSFDSIMHTYDANDGFAAYMFKDDYYFNMEVAFAEKKYQSHSLLNKSEDIIRFYRFDTNPRTIPSGLLKIKTPTFLHKTNKADAAVFVGDRYFTFEGDQLHLYKKGVSGVINFQTTYPVSAIFPGFESPRVDAVHASVNEREDSVTFTLFHGSQMWQYKEYRDSGHDNLLLTPIADKQNVPISEWHGVPACNIDSVFEYRGVPYFVKGNIFWPATDSEPAIARDITYNFFRCWENEPAGLEIPSGCNSPGNGVAGHHNILSILILIGSIISSIFPNLFF